jgi:hypothetical protein
MENELATAYSSQNPQTDQMAAQGRKGDAMMAHVTPGDYVIPKDILIQHPEFLTKLKKVMEDEHEDYRTHMVGSGFENINPETNAPEFGFKLKNFGRAFLNTATGGLSAPLIGGSSSYKENLGALYSGGTNRLAESEMASKQARANPPMTPYSPTEMALPGSLQELGGLSDQQKRSYLATQGSQGEGLGGSGAEYYANLLQRNIQANPNQSLLPVESQYLNQRGINTNLQGQALIDALRGF